jgi:predicted component of type VI protein secretion system
MPAHLLALTGGPSILLDKPILLLGRDPECDIQLDSPKVSRRHCCIAQVGEALVVRDLASTNGIRINGVRVIEGHLKEGDELTVGNHRFQVRWDALGLGAAKAGRTGVPPVASLNSPAGQAGDEVLESSDEPVALPDPQDAPADVPKARPLAANQPAAAVPPASDEGTDRTPSAPLDEIIGGMPNVRAPVSPVAPSPPPSAPPSS